MWFFFGSVAIVTAILNVAWTLQHREAKWFRFTSLSCTALTLCAFCQLQDRWVLKEDWSALMDVAGLSRLLQILTVTSILINSTSLLLPLLDKRHKHNI